MEKKRNIRLEGAENKPILLDAFYNPDNHKQPVVIFTHGFKGFKDWGTFDLIGDHFVNAGFVFLKFNFSHNGVPPENPYEITDPETFGLNNFTKELSDLDAVIDWIKRTQLIPEEVIDTSRINLVGHSRGGSIVLLKSYEHDSVQKCVSWSAPCDLYQRWRESEFDQWKSEGVYYVVNGRNGDQLPLYWQLGEDMEHNRGRLDIQHAIKNIGKPTMIAHGTEDEAVPQEDAIQLKSWNRDIKLELIPGGSHTFGGYHPFHETKLPQALEQLVNSTIKFLKNS